MTVALLPNTTPVTWRGMTSAIAGRPVFGIGLMTFDGDILQYAITDLDLWRLIEQALETLPGERARQLRTLLQRSRDGGSDAEAGSMPRGVRLQSPDSSRFSTSSAEGA